MEGIFKILQLHNLWSNECKMDEYCFRFALWRWNSPFVEASAEHKWSERFIAMFNATKHNIRPFHIHVFINMSDCNILFITEIIKFNLKIRNTTYRWQFLSQTPVKSQSWKNVLTTKYHSAMVNYISNEPHNKPTT